MAQHSWLSKHGSFQESEKADAARSAMMRRLPARRWRVARRRSLVLPIGATRCVLWRFEMDQRQVVTEIQRSGGVQSMESEMATEMWRNALWSESGTLSRLAAAVSSLALGENLGMVILPWLLGVTQPSLYLDARIREP